MQKAPDDIIIFLLVTVLLILCMAGFIISILFLYRKRQIKFQKETDKMKIDFEKNLLSTRLEIQEETFSHISREIHDNISLSLTLAKLNLNTLNFDDKQKAIEQVKDSVDLLTGSIAELSEISKSLNAELIIQQGLLKVLDNEMERIENAARFKINYRVTGNPVYLDGQKELIIFRIIQEAFNNIIKHAGASAAELMLHYNESNLYIDISDNGKGFALQQTGSGRSAGLKNMESRVSMIKGKMQIRSEPGQGTYLNFTIPFE